MITFAIVTGLLIGLIIGGIQLFYGIRRINRNNKEEQMRIYREQCKVHPEIRDYVTRHN